MKPRSLPFCLLLILMPFISKAQIDTLKLNKPYFKKYWTDTKSIATSPARWDGKDWTRFAVFTGTTVSMFFVDEPIRDGFDSFHSYTGEGGEKFSTKVLEPFGAEYTLAAAGTFIVYGLLAKDIKSQSTGLLAMESFILASAFVRVPKILLGRSRPLEDDVSPFDFNGPGKGSSFPSGHTIAVFSVASVIANQYSDKRWVPIASYSVATLAGLSRIYDHKHWASDVFAGAVFGILIGNLVSNKDHNSKITVIPSYTNSIKGIKLALTL